MSTKTYTFLVIVIKRRTWYNIMAKETDRFHKSSKENRDGE